MINRLSLALVVALSPLGALAGGLDTPVETPLLMPPIAAPAPFLIFTLGGGARVEPSYFGADSYEAVPDISFSLDYLKLGKNHSIGSTDPDHVPSGLAPRFSFRVIKTRAASDHAELAGLNDIDTAVELGFGLIYRQQNFEIFGDGRYGVIGHEAWVGEFGANLVARPVDGLTLKLGPRLFVGDESYAATYFGVTPAESVASGLAAFAPSGGALSAGVELGATYALNDRWNLYGGMRYDRLLNDAAGSPITGLGSADQFSINLGLTRRFVLNF